MPPLNQANPPADLDELAALPGGASRWKTYIRHTLADAAANLADLRLRGDDGAVMVPRFYDAQVFSPPGPPMMALPILWNAFPRRLLNRFGREKALQVADLLWPHEPDPDFDPLSPQFSRAIAEATSWIRPQDEYCEWLVERDPQTQGIRRIVFTTESPESWMALHGTLNMLRLRPSDDPFPFPGSAQRAAAGYSRRLGQTITAAELQWGTEGKYDVRNRWNTTHGIVHLTHPVNNLNTHVRLVADSMVPRSRPGDGRLITHPDALCSALAGGDPNTHADPAIAGSVNALARQGAWVTLPDPVGVVIEHIDTSGWAWPDGSPASDCWHIAIGAPGRIRRLVVEAPAGSARTLAQLRIGGEPLLHGGQVAECITVKAVVACVLPPGARPPLPLPAERRAGLSDANRHLLRKVGATSQLPAGHMPAFALPAPPPGASP